MSFDKIFDLTAGVYFNFYNIYLYFFLCDLIASVLQQPMPGAHVF